MSGRRARPRRAARPGRGGTCSLRRVLRVVEPRHVDRRAVGRAVARVGERHRAGGAGGEVGERLDREEPPGVVGEVVRALEGHLGVRRERAGLRPACARARLSARLLLPHEVLALGEALRARRRRLDRGADLEAASAQAVELLRRCRRRWPAGARRPAVEVLREVIALAHELIERVLVGQEELHELLVLPGHVVVVGPGRRGDDQERCEQAQSRHQLSWTGPPVDRRTACQLSDQIPGRLERGDAYTAPRSTRIAREQARRRAPGACRRSGP